MSTDAKAFEKALHDTSKLAESWSAVVVLQQADIYLSQTREIEMKHERLVSSRRLTATVFPYTL